MIIGQRASLARLASVSVSTSPFSRLARVGVGLALLGATLVLAGSSSAAPPRVVAPTTAPWQYQLQVDAAGRLSSSGGIDMSCAPSVIGAHCARPAVFDIDLYDASGRVPNSLAVAAIHRARGYAICYVDAGTWESWRPDAKSFPPRRLGRSNGWSGERWLDIRRPSVLLAIMGRRLTRCRDAGFDAVEFDNVDAFANATGFPITSADQLRYNLALARLAHQTGLAVGLKNDPGQVGRLEPSFDFAVDEQCIEFHFCAALAPFVAAHKPVYDVEYAGSPLLVCRAAPPHVEVILKRLSLHARPWAPCVS